RTLHAAGGDRSRGHGVSWPGALSTWDAAARRVAQRLRAEACADRSRLTGTRGAAVAGDRGALSAAGGRAAAEPHRRSRETGARHVCARAVDAGRQRALRRHVRRQPVEQEHGPPRHPAAESGLRHVAPARPQRPADRYLFLDGQYHAARQGTDEKEGVLSAYALLEDGRPVLLHLALGPRESYD